MSDPRLEHSAASGSAPGASGVLFEDLAPVASEPEVVERFASLSPCKRYRYALGRTWDYARKPVLFVGLNPSTADAEVDDPTIRRCMRFARDWGYGGVLMGNLFGFRATDPQAMMAAVDPVGERTDWWLQRMAHMAGLVVACWGARGKHRDRARAVVESGALGSLTVLGLTKDGHPRHPLYMRASCVPLNPLTLAPTRNRPEPTGEGASA